MSHVCWYLFHPFPKITCWKGLCKVWKWISTLPHSDGRSWMSWVLACHPPNMLQRWFWSLESSLNLRFQIYQPYKAHMFTSFLRYLFRSIRTELLLRWIAGCLMVKGSIPQSTPTHRLQKKMLPKEMGLSEIQCTQFQLEWSFYVPSKKLQCLNTPTGHLPVYLFMSVSINGWLICIPIAFGENHKLIISPNKQCLTCQPSNMLKHPDAF